MPKITFVYPDFENLGVEYLMSVCLEDGHEVDFVYYHAEDPYFNKKSDNILFNQIAGRISETHPDIVAFSCVTDNYQYQLNCARALKEEMPNAITIFGGIHPTAVPDRVLQNDAVDCVAIGEAEKSFSDFLKACDGEGSFDLPDDKIEGIVFKKNAKIIGDFKEGPLIDLNLLPVPYKDPFFKSLKDSSFEYRIITSRGCPYSCSYCFNSHIHLLRGNRLIRQRTVDNVIAELIYAKKNNTCKFISFSDDSFTTNMKWILQFCDRYKKEIGMPFGCIANPHYINRRIAEALSSAGCIFVQIGVQSISEELCKNILNRRSDNDKIAEVLKDLRDVGIMVQVDHMLGIPDDNLKIQEESILFYSRHKPSQISVFWLTYYPKTRIVEIAKQRGILSEDDINNIEEGKRLTGFSYIAGGDMRNPKPYYSIAFLLNYLPILPKWLINFLVFSRLYRGLKIKNYIISTAFPRVIQGLFNPKDFRGKSHIRRFLDKTFLHNFK